MKVLVMKKKIVIKLVLFGIVIASAMMYSLYTESESAFLIGIQPEISCVKTEEKVAAITIDTAFGEDYTEEILDILNQSGAKATFAVMGLWAENNTGEVKMIANSGHEIMLHSMNHGRYTDMDEDSIKDDADNAKKVLEQLTGKELSLIRAPYGSYDDNSLKALRSGGYVPIKWSIDAEDWKTGDAETCAANVTNNIKPGCIIMFQNNNKITPEAIRITIKALKECGYSIVSVSELIYGGNR